jgi:hypothetical protein
VRFAEREEKGSGTQRNINSNRKSFFESVGIDFANTRGNIKHKLKNNPMAKSKTINVQGTDSIILRENNKDEFISLTGIARYRDSERSDYILQNWLRNRSTIEFVGLWEQFNNPNFNSIEFDGIKNSAGSNSFSLTPKRWIEATNAIGIISRTGKYGGTFAHRDMTTPVRQPGLAKTKPRTANN